MPHFCYQHRYSQNVFRLPIFLSVIYMLANWVRSEDACVVLAVQIRTWEKKVTKSLIFKNSRRTNNAKTNSVQGWMEWKIFTKGNLLIRAWGRDGGNCHLHEEKENAHQAIKWFGLLQSNLYITALYIAVTLHITVTWQLPKIFSCLIFSAKLTCI